MYQERELDLPNGVRLSQDRQHRPTLVGTVKAGHAMSAISKQQFATLLQSLDEHCGALLRGSDAATASADDTTPATAGATGDSWFVIYVKSVGWNRLLSVDSINAYGLLGLWTVCASWETGQGANADAR